MSQKLFLLQCVLTKGMKITQKYCHVQQLVDVLVYFSEVALDTIFENIEKLLHQLILAS